MSKFIMVVFALIFVAEPLFARCNGSYANHLIRARYTECSRDVADAIKDWDQSKNNNQLDSVISRICGNGCYDAMLNPAAAPDCDKKYAEALAQIDFSEAVKGLNCKDSGQYIKGQAVTAAVSASESCVWTTRNSSTLTCGGGAKNTNICGVGASVICAGSVACSKKFKLDNSTHDSGVYQLSCLATKSCAETSMENCMREPSVTMLSNELIRPEAGGFGGARGE